MRRSGAGLWRGNGPYGEDQRLLPVADVAASPDYTADGTLFAATTEGIYRSTVRGGSWQRVLVSLIACRAAAPGPISLPNVSRSIPSPTPTPTPVTLQPRWLRSLMAAPGENGALTALTNEGRLVRNTDRGATWSYLPPKTQFFLSLP